MYVHFLPVFPDILKSVDFWKIKINVNYTLNKIEAVRRRGHSVLQCEDT